LVFLIAFPDPGRCIAIAGNARDLFIEQHTHLG
jgi:hypothetical protein